MAENENVGEQSSSVSSTTGKLAAALEKQQAMIAESADKLSRQLEKINATVSQATEIRDELVVLNRRGKLNRTMIWALVISFLISFVLIVGLIRLVNEQRTSSDRLAVLTSKIDTELTVQRDQALCPLYKLFIDADTPQSREAASKRGDDLKARDEAFIKIRQSYEALRCKNVIGGSK